MTLPGAGGIVGGKLDSPAGRMFGLEIEGLSYEDQEFEAPRSAGAEWESATARMRSNRAG